jgi:hypothetical protein
MRNCLLTLVVVLPCVSMMSEAIGVCKPGTSPRYHRDANKFYKLCNFENRDDIWCNLGESRAHKARAYPLANFGRDYQDVDPSLIKKSKDISEANYRKHYTCREI